MATKREVGDPHFAKIPFDDPRLIDNPRITIIEREPDQNIFPLYEYWTGNDRRELMQRSRS